MLWAALLLLSTVPHDCVVRDRVDVIETNHFYNENADWVFDQLIFYDWSSENARFQVVAYRLAKNPGDNSTGRKAMPPVLIGSQYSSTWIEGDVLREVTAPSIRETWTQHDVEVEERQYLPKEMRRQLTEPIKR